MNIQKFSLFFIINNKYCIIINIYYKKLKVGETEVGWNNGELKQQRYLEINNSR